MARKADETPRTGELVPATDPANASALTHFDDDRIREAEFRRQQLARAAALGEIDTTYGDTQPYDRGRLVSEVRWYLAQTAAAALEAGRRLILLKEHEAHGDWLAVLEDLQLAPRTAQRLMQSVARLLEGPRRALAERLTQTKLLELLIEDDDALDALATGGTVAGVTLDAIDRMSARELRSALRTQQRDRRETQETTDRLLADKNKKIDDLHGKLMAAEQRSLLGDQQPELDAAQLGHDLALRTQAVLDALFGLERLTAALAERDLPVHIGEALASGLTRIGEHIDRIREIGAAIVPADTGDDAGWLAEAARADGARPN
ncbi:DUF3102 domain-containing protein [Plasticicumulans sp.]|uniref:DUF3102 domain-containing protein n=1 Tax=Plasticicumulans sp. TaxID=2307179 RepID=UPI0032206AE6